MATWYCTEDQYVVIQWECERAVNALDFTGRGLANGTVEAVKEWRQHAWSDMARARVLQYTVPGLTLTGIRWQRKQNCILYEREDDIGSDESNIGEIEYNEDAVNFESEPDEEMSQGYSEDDEPAIIKLQSNKDNWLISTPMPICDKVSNAGGSNSDATSPHGEVAAERPLTAGRIYTFVIFCGSYWLVRKGKLSIPEEKTFLNLTADNDEVGNNITFVEMVIDCEEVDINKIGHFQVFLQWTSCRTGMVTSKSTSGQFMRI